MPGNLVINVLLSLAYLLFGSFLAALPIFVFVCLGWLIHKLTLKPKRKFSWLARSIAITYAIVLCITALAYFTPLVLANQAANIGQMPSDIAPDFLTETLLEWIFYIFRTLAVALVIVLLLMPLELFGAYVNELILKRYNVHKLVSVFIATFIATFTAITIVMFFPGIPAGIIYLVYFA